MFAEPRAFSALDTIHVAVAAVALGLAVTAAEMLWLWSKGHYADQGIWPWPILKESYSPSVATKLGPFMSNDAIPVLAATRMAAATATVACIAVRWPATMPILVLLAIQFLLQLRGRWGGEGADQMTTLVLVTGAVAEVGRGQATVTEAAALFIGGQITLSYLASGTAKLFGPLWRSGAALPKIMNHHTYGNPGLRDLLMRHPLAARFLGGGVIAFQMTFWLFYLLPMPWALLYIAAGVAFHAGIAIFMRLNLFLITFVGTYPCLLLTRALIRTWWLGP